MSIPSIVLTSKTAIPNETVSLHQKFALDLLTAASSKKKQNSLKEQTFSLPKNLRDAIYQWFFNLDTKTKVKVASIKNIWLVKILAQLWRIVYYDQWTQFVPSVYMLEFFPELEGLNSEINYEENNDLLFYPSFFNTSNSQFISLGESGNQLKQTEKEFVNYVRFMSTVDENDTLTLDQSFISDEVRFKIIMEALTEGQFLQFSSFPEINKQFNVYNFVLPPWTRNKEKFSLAQILAMYFEQTIMLNYEYYYYTKNVYAFPQNEKITTIYDENDKMRKFLYEETAEDIKRKQIFFDLLDFNKIESEYKSNNSYKEIVDEFHKMNDKVYGKFYASPVLSGERRVNLQRMIEIKDNLRVIFIKSTVHFIYSLTFFGFDDIFEDTNFIYKQTYKYIYDMYIEKNVDFLIKEIESTSTSTKKKKHKKKKKNKEEKKEEKKEEDVKEENTISNESLLKELESIDESKKDTNNNNSNKNNSNEKKNKKKKNNIYLYPTISKKKQKQQEQKPQQKQKEPKANSITSSTNHTIQISPQSTEYIQTNNNFFYPNQTYFPIQPIIFNSYNIQYNISPNSQIQKDSKFFEFLSQEIISFNNTVENNIKLLKQYRVSLLEKIKNIIIKALEKDYSIEFHQYGSFQTELAIESSDIDIMIKYLPKKEDNTEIVCVLSELDSYLNQEEIKKLFEYINPIYTASVPVIKLQCDLSSEIPKSVTEQILSSYLFDKDEIIKLKFDIIFKLNKDDIGYQITPLQSVDFVKKSIEEHPSIKPLIIVIKRYMKVQKLNNSYKGGISSYSLFLLLYSFLQFKQKDNINFGLFLYEFFEFYATFEFERFTVQPGEQNPFVISKESNGSIAILDPVTKFNVSKSSFKISEIKSAFLKAESFIKVNAIASSTNVKEILSGLFLL